MEIRLIRDSTSSPELRVSRAGQFGDGGVDIRRDDLVEQTRKLGIGEGDVVEGPGTSHGSFSQARRGPGCPDDTRTSSLEVFRRGDLQSGVLAKSWRPID